MGLWLAWLTALALGLSGAEALAARAPASAGGQHIAAERRPTQVARRNKKKKKNKRGKGKKGSDDAAQKDSSAPSGTLDLSAPQPSSEPAASGSGDSGAAGGAVLDLSTVDEDTQKAKEELLKGASEEKSDQPATVKKKDGGFDFGGGASLDFGEGAVDFGSELGEFDLQAQVGSAEQERFDKAMAMMSDEDYAGAALEFRFFIEDAKFKPFLPEIEYQLAKALYKLGFLDASLKRFKSILEQGPTHRRYRKSVEWLFFISRKMADETPVLAELARFRNVTFPKAYRNEYRYLLGKYLFVQAERFEVERLEAEQLAKGKKSKEATLDFSAIAEAVDSGQGLDFGGGSGGSGGGFDFGDGGDSGSGGGGGGGGFDFGAGSDNGGSGAGFDFGGGAPAPVDENAPVREAAPTNTKEAVAQGVDFVTQVEKSSRFYPKAKYLEGLLSYLGGADQKAVDAFQEVVRVLNPKGGSRLDPKLRELAFLSLARIHYGYKQFNRSVYYYDLIDRDSENWLTALFEASWAYYRRGDFEKALGNLLTLHSPFFEREYFPESQLVKAIIYFEACRYPETREITDKFIQRFTQVMKAIQSIAESKEAPELLYERIAKLQEDAAREDDDVTSRVVSLALADTEIRTARNVVDQIKDELDLWRNTPEAFRLSRLGGELNEELKQLLAERVREAGEVTRRKFEQELYGLKSLLAQALRIKLEVARSEREELERKLRGEKGDELVPATARTVVDDEHLYWPYEGEYWRDELGTYELDFTMCHPLAAGP